MRRRASGRGGWRAQARLLPSNVRLGPRVSLRRCAASSASSVQTTWSKASRSDAGDQRSLARGAPSKARSRATAGATGLSKACERGRDGEPSALADGAVGDAGEAGEAERAVLAARAAGG